MRPKLHAAAGAIFFFVFIVSACKKESPTKNPTCPFDLQLLKGGTWINNQNTSSQSTMKFRFYGTSNVTYTFRTAVYPSLKYDSFPNGKWELILPDTLRLYDRSWNYYGYLHILKLSNTELQSRLPGYNDTMVFTKEQ